ncbi:hypothetical protein PIB30_096543, partial [Stylosanthes scabra]|nr:hypothetical protein [Stylosanthes scabra]
KRGLDVGWVRKGLSCFSHVLPKTWPRRGVRGGMVGMGLAYISATFLCGQNVAQGWPNMMCVCISDRLGWVVRFPNVISGSGGQAEGMGRWVTFGFLA